MKQLIRHAALLIAVLLPAAAMAGASVTYVHPEKMTDVPRNSADREEMQTALDQHFNELAARLPAGQTLKVEILDIDLAGDVFPRVALEHTRVYRDRASRVAIHLRYSIEQDGKVISSAERKLSDMSYLTGANRYSTESFPYEKQLLDTWFRKDIVAAR